jgi:hypothetical protein
MPHAAPPALSARAFVESLSDSLAAAAASVRWLAGRVRNTPKRGERTASKQALCEADCVSQEILLAGLRRHFPGVELDAEEDTPGVAAFAGNRCEYRVLIDPIDGTLHYLDRDGVYAILVGLERDGRVEAALVAVPEADILIRAVRGHGTELAQGGGAFAPVHCTPSGSGRRLLISKTLEPAAQHALRKREYELSASSGGAIGVAPLLPETCAAIRIGDGAEGVSRRTWVSSLATLEAGGSVETLSGPFPQQYEPGIAGVIVGPSEAYGRELRRILTS